MPPLVTSWEVVLLKRQLAEAAAGERFVLQGGDCAERFADCTSPRVANLLKVLLQMSLVLVVGAQAAGHPRGALRRPVCQAALEPNGDPRRRDAALLPRRHDQPAGIHRRRAPPDPHLLLRAYERSGLTLNFIRALVKGGFADLHHPEYFDLDWVEQSPLAEEYHRMVETIGESLRFMENVLGVRAGETDRIDFFTAHEALHLGYEEAQTRRVPRRPGWFNLATHFPWAGLRTNHAGGRAHRVPAGHRESDRHQGRPRHHPRESGALAGDTRSARASRGA